MAKNEQKVICNATGQTISPKVRNYFLKPKIELDKWARIVYTIGSNKSGTATRNSSTPVILLTNWKGNKMIDWGSIKIQYEMFGKSAKELAAENECSEQRITYVAETELWQVNEKALQVQDLSTLDVQNVDEDLLTQVQDRLQILETFKKETLGPLYFRMEASLITKCLSAIKDLPTDDPGTPSKLKIMADIITSLRPVAPADKKGDNSISVRIMNQSTEHGSTGVEVSIQGEAIH